VQKEVTFTEKREKKSVKVRFDEGPCVIPQSDDTVERSNSVRPFHSSKKIGNLFSVAESKMLIEIEPESA
jgi:hypothetical protein